MSSSIKSLIFSMLEESVELMRTQLGPLDITHPGEQLFITHDGNCIITVYTTRTLKAYIPKKFDGWKVSIVEWDGEDLPIDIDQEILLED